MVCLKSPAASVAWTVSLWVPTLIETLVLNELEATLYPPTPSTNICSLVTVFESVAPATTCTGELTLALLVGWQIVTVRLVVFSVHAGLAVRKKFKSLA